MEAVDLQELKRKAEAADKDGTHIYTNLRDAINWKTNDEWHVAASPEALVADVCMLPDSAMNNRHPFDYTGKMLSAAGKCIAEAVTPEKGAEE